MSDFQRAAGDQGRMFDEQARYIMRDLGWTVGDAPIVEPGLGIEIDAEAKAASGTVAWCEFKGSWRGGRPGMIRTDTVKKALCSALLLHLDPAPHPPFIVVTSHLPERGVAARWIALVMEAGALLDVFCLNDPRDVVRLGRLAHEL